MLQLYFITTVYLCIMFVFMPLKPGFNTSHVVVYLRKTYQKRLHYYCFNTSHVVVYQFACSQEYLLVHGFNTSHVVVYHELDNEGISEKEAFQYISCCSLSRTGSCQSFFFACFNTSHVVVYQYGVTKAFEYT